MAKLGDGIWVHDKYLAYLREPKDMDIILFCRGNPGTCMAVAPEWQEAIGFGASIEEASADLQSKLVGTKLLFIQRKMGDFIKQIPMDPCGQRARDTRNGLCNGYYDDEEKAYFDEREKDSSAVEWCTIQVRESQARKGHCILPEHKVDFAAVLKRMKHGLPTTGEIRYLT